MATKPVAAVLVFFVGLLATAEESRLIFEDDFERYTNSAAFRAVWPQGAAVLELHSPGGGQAARHDGGDADRRGGFSVLPSLAHNVVLTADLFDFGTNANKHVTVALHYRKGAWLEIRPAPQCPWWPYVWSQQTRVRVGDDGKVPVGLQRHSIDVPPRTTLIRCLRPDGDIYYLRHAPAPDANPIVLLHCPIF